MRWKPKQWLRPGTRRFREEMAHRRHPEVNVAYEIIKTLWPSGHDRVRPAWADTSRKFGWLTTVEYYAIKPRLVPIKNALFELIYAKSPLFDLITKKPDFAGKAAAE